MRQYEIRDVSMDECEMPQKKSGSQTMYVLVFRTVYTSPWRR